MAVTIVSTGIAEENIPVAKPSMMTVAGPMTA